MKGILFKPDMHLAIREGRKTVTRRIMNPQPYNWTGVMRWAKSDSVDINMDDHADLAIPYARYQIGEVVYIKEAWRYRNEDGDINDFSVEYKDGQKIGWRDNAGEMDYPIDEKWHSPMFLKAIHARDFIQITAVRAERLNQINEEDAVAEGIKADPTIAIFEYSRLWNSINKEYSWLSNPFVFRYEFKKVD